jgi:rubrerythrin
MKSGKELRALYPHMSDPMCCENGCGAVMEIADAYLSYKKDERGERLFICECCAAEEGHLWEDDETPETAPVCRRKPKIKLR